MMTILHAFAVVITILLFLIRDRYTSAGVCNVKRVSISALECSCGDTSLNSESSPSKDCAVCARASSYSNKKICVQPKYKRDPDIQVEDEYLGNDPHD